MDTESELMLRLAEGDESALGRLYERLSGNVFSLALHMVGNREDAEEVLQDSFVNLYRSARRFDPSLGSVRAYAYTIARNQARMKLRSRKSRPVTQPIEEREAVTQPSDGAAAVALNGALSRLESDEVRLLEATFFDGFSHSELAERTGLPLGTLKSRIRRALLKLRGIMGES
ncbi:MAG TPA: sigma-70 family RNA polymerase sigma factor [Trueperaceae bacterium]